MQFTWVTYCLPSSSPAHDNLAYLLFLTHYQLGWYMYHPFFLPLTMWQSYCGIKKSSYLCIVFEREKVTAGGQPFDGSQDSGNADF